MLTFLLSVFFLLYSTMYFEESKTYLALFTIFLFTTSACYLIVFFLSAVLLYNKEKVSNKNKEKTLRCVQTFDQYCRY